MKLQPMEACRPDQAKAIQSMTTIVADPNYKIGRQLLNHVISGLLDDNDNHHDNHDHHAIDAKNQPPFPSSSDRAFQPLDDSERALIEEELDALVDSIRHKQKVDRVRRGSTITIKLPQWGSHRRSFMDLMHRERAFRYDDVVTAEESDIVSRQINDTTPVEVYLSALIAAAPHRTMKKNKRDGDGDGDKHDDKYDDKHDDKHGELKKHMVRTVLNGANRQMDDDMMKAHGTSQQDDPATDGVIAEIDEEEDEEEEQALNRIAEEGEEGDDDDSDMDADEDAAEEGDMATEVVQLLDVMKQSSNESCREVTSLKSADELVKGLQSYKQRKGSVLRKRMMLKRRMRMMMGMGMDSSSSLGTSSWSPRRGAAVHMSSTYDYDYSRTSTHSSKADDDQDHHVPSTDVMHHQHPIQDASSSPESYSDNIILNPKLLEFIEEILNYKGRDRWAILQSMRNRRISSSGIQIGPLSISTKLGHQIKDPLSLAPGGSLQSLDRDRSRSPNGKLLSSDTIMDSSSRPSTRSNDRKPVPQSPSPSRSKRIQATTNNKLNTLLNRQSVLLMGEAKGVLGMKGKNKTHLPYPSSPGMLAESDLRMLNMIARQVSTPAAALSSSLSSGASELGSNDRKRVQLSEGTTTTGASTTTTQLQSPGFEFTDSIISSEDDDSSIKDIETSVMDYKRMVLESADQSFVKIKEKYNQLMKTISSQHRKEEAVSRRQSLSDNQGDNYGTLFGSLYDDGDDDGDVTYLYDETRTIDPAVIADDDAVDIAASSHIAGSSPSIIADISAASPSTGIYITPAIHHHDPRINNRKKSVTFEVVAPHHHPHPHPPIDSSVSPSSMMMHSPMKKRVVIKQ